MSRIGNRIITVPAGVTVEEADGVVTAGPTQAVIVAAHMVIRRIRGMKRVALCPTIPSFKESGALMLDVGANVEGEYIITRISLPLSYNGMM